MDIDASSQAKGSRFDWREEGFHSNRSRWLVMPVAKAPTSYQVHLLLERQSQAMKEANNGHRERVF